jgi:hypothetical protein
MIGNLARRLCADRADTPPEEHKDPARTNNFAWPVRKENRSEFTWFDWSVRKSGQGEYRF